MPAAALPDGAHTLEVRATDEAENTDPTPASRSFTVDTEAPSPGPTPSPEGGGILPPPVFSDATPPSCRLSAMRRQIAGRPVALKVGCDEEVTATAVGRVVVMRRTRRTIRFGLRIVTMKLPAGRSATLRMRPKSRKAGRRLKRLAGRSRGARAAIRIKCVDRAGNSTIRHLMMKLTG
jgi:hypothetical protein